MWAVGEQNLLAVKKKYENKLISVEMRMLRWARGKTRLDRIISEDIRKKAHVKPVETTYRKQKTKVVWPLLETRPLHIPAKSLSLEVSGRRSRCRPKKRWRDNNIYGYIKKYQLTGDMAQYRKYWMTQIMAHDGDGQERCERWER